MKSPIVFLIKIALVFTGMALSSCSMATPVVTIVSVPAQPHPENDITPFVFEASTETLPSVFPATNTPAPLPTATPRTHVVAKGEDLFGISILYGISLEDLMAANADVNPNMMSIGTVLIIPESSDPAPTAGATPAGFITPTAIPVSPGRLFCAATREGGVWCAQAVTNMRDFPLEGVQAYFYLVDSAGKDVRSQKAFLPLDLLYPGQSLPLSAYFPPPAPEFFLARSEMLSALPYPDDGRYLQTRIEHSQILIAGDGLSAAVSLELLLETEEVTARIVRVSAVAYDQQGAVVGVRRWEQSGDQLLNPGQRLPINFMVYSTAAAIMRVELVAEARP